jgi:hypothetical protein
MQNRKISRVFGLLVVFTGGLVMMGCSGSRVPLLSAKRTKVEKGQSVGVSPIPENGARVEPRRETEWLAILINGKKSGYVKSTRTVYVDEVETETTTAMEMRRGSVNTNITTISTTMERPDGTPIGFKKRTVGVGMDQQVSGTITSNGTLRVITESAGSGSTREMSWPKGALMNEGQRLEAFRYGLKEGISYTSKYFDPDLLEVLEVAVHVGKRKPLNLFGRVVTGTEVTLKMNVRGNAITLLMYVEASITHYPFCPGTR